MTVFFLVRLQQLEAFGPRSGALTGNPSKPNAVQLSHPFLTQFAILVGTPLTHHPASKLDPTILCTLRHPTMTMFLLVRLQEFE